MRNILAFVLCTFILHLQARSVIIVDDTPYTNEHIYDLIGHLNDVAPVNQYFQSVSDTHIFKLTWRNKFSRKVDGQETLYGQLIDRY